MSCDIRICADTAVFGQPEAGLGITPRLRRHPAAGPSGWPRHGQAADLHRQEHQGRRGPADRAGEQRLSGAGAAARSGEAGRDHRQERPPIAVRACKKAINDGLQVDMDRAVTIEEKLFGSCFETADQKEGHGRFSGKAQARAPTRTGKALSERCFPGIAPGGQTKGPYIF